MIIYGIKLISAPHIKYACSITTCNYKNSFFAQKDEIEITFIEKTSLVFNFSDGEVIFPEKSLLIRCEPFVATAKPLCKGIHKHTTIGVNVQYTAEKIDLNSLDYTINNKYDFIIPNNFKPKNSEIILKLINEISEKHLYYPNENELLIISYWYKLLFIISNDFKEQLQYQPEYKKPSAKLYTQRAIEYILKNYNKKLKIIEIADYLDISPNYLHYIFKAVMGKTINNFLNETRIDITKKLLELYIPLDDIAEKVGINNANYLSRLFKKITGVNIHDYIILDKNLGIDIKSLPVK